MTAFSSSTICHVISLPNLSCINSITTSSFSFSTNTMFFSSQTDVIVFEESKGTPLTSTILKSISWIPTGTSISNSMFSILYDAILPFHSYSKVSPLSTSINIFIDVISSRPLFIIQTVKVLTSEQISFCLSLILSIYGKRDS